MFIKPSKNLKLTTTKGEIELSSTEYFILQDKKSGREPLVINKEGTQKIEDFFGVETEIRGEGAILDNVYVKVRMTTPEGLKVERIGSANNRSLSNEIARAYAVEMAFKRACATAALEILRKNYVGDSPLPLLYSSFDEFKTESSINQNVPEEEESPATSVQSANSEEETPETSPVETTDMVEVSTEENPFAEKPVENKNDGVIASNLGTFVIKSNKYRNGVTLAELAEKDINYLNWLVKGDNMRGRYKEYQETARKFVEEAGIELPA